MGEKEIVEVEEAEIGPIVPGGGTMGGGSTDRPLGGTRDGGGLVNGPGLTPGGPAGPPSTQERKDPCAGLKAQAEALLQQLEGLHTQNREQTQRALRAFFGDPANTLADGYAHWFTQAKVTEAVVDASNATAKTLIDVALFALGGWGAIGKATSAVGKASKLEKMFGTGLAGAESALDAYGKIALKVTEKVVDEYVGGKAGKAGSTLYKTIDKLESKPEKWFQPSLGVIESIVRSSIIDALGNWMKAGAMSGDLGRAATAYADFFAAAMAANVSAAAAAQIHQQIQDLNTQLRAIPCPEVSIPDYVFYTFGTAQFGQGAFRGQAGPTMHSHSLESGNDRDWDLFANVADTRGLPF